VWLLRHGATEWTADELHTGAREVSLSEAGREQARRAGKLLAGRRFGTVLVSPQTRAIETCRLAGYADQATLSDDLVEWDYGDYEGRKSSEILAGRPGWRLFRDGCPNGEQPADVGARATASSPAFARRMIARSCFPAAIS
jgi:broad specificity phosphatase PhoE